MSFCYWKTFEWLSYANSRGLFKKKKKKKTDLFFMGNIPLRSGHAYPLVGPQTHHILAPLDALFQPFIWLISVILQVQLKWRLLQETLLSPLDWWPSSVVSQHLVFFPYSSIYHIDRQLPVYLSVLPNVISNLRTGTHGLFTIISLAPSMVPGT